MFAWQFATRPRIPRGLRSSTFLQLHVFLLFLPIYTDRVAGRRRNGPGGTDPLFHNIAQRSSRARHRRPRAQPNRADQAAELPNTRYQQPHRAAAELETRRDDRQHKVRGPPAGRTRDLPQPRRCSARDAREPSSSNPKTDELRRDRNRRAPNANARRLESKRGAPRTRRQPRQPETNPAGSEDDRVVES